MSTVYNLANITKNVIFLGMAKSTKKNGKKMKKIRRIYTS